jgi:hypothetical protein
MPQEVKADFVGWRSKPPSSRMLHVALCGRGVDKKANLPLAACRESAATPQTAYPSSDCPYRTFRCRLLGLLNPATSCLWILLTCLFEMLSRQISAICFDRLSRPRIVDQTVHERAYAATTFLSHNNAWRIIPFSDDLAELERGKIEVT